MVVCDVVIIPAGARSAGVAATGPRVGGVRAAQAGTASAAAARVAVARVAGRAGVGVGVGVGPATAAETGARAAGIRIAGALRRAGVGIGGAVRAGVAGRWRDQRQRAEQQADERDRAQVIQAAAHPRGLHRPGDRGQPGHRRRGVHRRQPRPGQRRGIRIRIGVQAHLRGPLRILAALLRALRVRGDDRAAQRHAQLPAGLPPSPRQDGGLHGAGGVIIQRAGRLGDEPGAVQVDGPGGQRGEGRGEPPSQGDGQAGPGHRGRVGHDQLQAHRRRGGGGDLVGAAAGIHADVVVAGGGTRGHLGDRGQLPGLRPPGQAAERRGYAGQVPLRQPGRVRAGQARRQRRARRQLIRQHPGHIPRRRPRIRRGRHRGGFLRGRVLVTGPAGRGGADRGQQLPEIQLMRPGQPLRAAGVVIHDLWSWHPDHLLHVAAGLSSSITVASASDNLATRTNTQAKKDSSFSGCLNLIRPGRPSTPAANPPAHPGLR